MQPRITLTILVALSLWACGDNDAYAPSAHAEAEPRTWADDEPVGTTLDGDSDDTSPCDPSTSSGEDGPTPATQPGHREGLYDSIWPADSANSNRSMTVVGAGLPRDVSPSSVAVLSVPMSFPVFSYTRDADEVFVVGGLPLVLSSYVSQIDGLPPGLTPVDPHITRFNPLTGEQAKLPLDLGYGLPYIGGALVHANGYVYAVSQAHLYKIEPSTMEIEASVDLPAHAIPQLTNYNGLAVSSSGTLITKRFFNEQASLVMVDPDSLEIVSTLSHSGTSARLSIDRASDGQEYAYHLDRAHTFRFLVEPSALVPDASWVAPYDPYGLGIGNNDEPTSPVVANGRVFYTTNTTPLATYAMKMFWQSVDEEYTEASPSLVGDYMFEDEVSTSWSFFHVAVDDADTGTIVGIDQNNGTIGAWQVTPEGTMIGQWERDLMVSARPSIVADRRMVYCNDLHDGRDHLVVLDLDTGDELYRVETAATRPTISSIIVGMNEDVYYGSNEPGQAQGLFHRFYVQP